MEEMAISKAIHQVKQLQPQPHDCYHQPAWWKLQWSGTNNCKSNL